MRLVALRTLGKSCILFPLGSRFFGRSFALVLKFLRARPQRDTCLTNQSEFGLHYAERSRKGDRAIQPATLSEADFCTTPISGCG